MYFLVILTCSAVVWGSQPVTRNEDFTGIRLTDGPLSNSGLVEVQLFTGAWLDVCDTGWGSMDGTVACRQLGFPGFSRSRSGSFFGLGTNNGSVDGFNCGRSQSNLAQCPHALRESRGCSSYAGLICTVPGYVGCYPNRRKTPLFAVSTKLRSDNMTISLCLQHCTDLGMVYSGLQNGQDCYCGDEGTNLVANGAKLYDSFCNNPCYGDNEEVCGDSGRLSVYNVSLGLCAGRRAPLNGYRMPPDTGNETFRFGSTVTFSCRDGHSLVGAPSARCILGDSLHAVLWDRPSPFCKAIYETTEMNATDKPHPKEIGGNIGSIAGVAVAGLLVLGILVAVAVWATCKRRRPLADNHAAPSSVDLANNTYSSTSEYRYQTSPVTQPAGPTPDEYQSLAPPTSDVTPYMELHQNGRKEPPKESDTPDYLELDGSPPVEMALSQPTYANLAESIFGTDPAGNQRLPSVEAEYAYVDPEPMSTNTLNKF